MRIFNDPDLTTSEWATALLAALVPIAAVVAMDPAGWFPFSIAKWAAVSIIAVAAVAMWMWSSFGVKYHLARWPAGGGPALGAVVGLVGIVAVSSVFAVDGRYAWTGTPIRHLGSTTWLLFGALFALGLTLGASTAATTIVVRGSVVAGLLLGLYTTVEAVFGPPVEFVSASVRLGGPFGSAAYLGAALCLLLPVGGATAFDSGSPRVWRVCGLIGVVTMTGALIGSGSRAALVGILSAVIVAVIARRPNGAALDSGARESRSAVMVVAAVILGVVAVAIGMWVGVFERSAGWTSRVDEWRLAARAIADHPLLGVGPEGYRLVAGEYVDADYVRRYGESVGIDRAHSGVLDVAVASGLIATLLYLGVFVLVLRSAWWLLRSGSTIEVGSALAVVAYAVQQQLLFPIAEIDPVFYLVAGIVVAGSFRSRALAAEDNGSVASDDAFPASEWPRRLVGAGLVVLTVVVAVAGVRAVAADRWARSATTATSVDVAQRQAERASELAPFDIRHRVLVARSQEHEQTLAGVDAALDAVGDAMSISPRDPTVLLEHARLLGLRASVTGDDETRRAARTAWTSLVDSWPACARCYTGSATAALERGDLDEARSEFEIAADLGDRIAVTALQRLDELDQN